MFVKNNNFTKGKWYTTERHKVQRHLNENFKY